MPQSCYIVAHQIISSLGDGSEENIREAENGKSGISLIPAGALSDRPFYGAIFSDEIRARLAQKSDQFTLLENGLIHCIESALSQYPVHQNERGALVLASTKGNIELLGASDHPTIPVSRANMAEMAKVISAHFGFENDPILISNACISGLSALLIAKKLLKSKAYDYVVVAGGDRVSKFVVRGFQSLMAVSETPCQPYDVARTGMTPGEGCAAVILSKTKPQAEAPQIHIAGGGQSNDANHISGPSRTGDGLVSAVSKALAEAKTSTEKIDFINAHGTATLYNDEMESIAFNRLKMQDVPLNSLKGYFGHTLGAAGLIETIFTAEALKSGQVLKTKGFETPGISKSLTILTENKILQNPSRALKTISGFGGCNAALILEKV